MDKQVPTCPYCGTEMFYYERRTKGYGVIGYYLCRLCESRAPRINNTGIDAADMKETACIEAMLRWQEPNRVLTLDEAQAHVDDPIWCEFASGIAQDGWYVGYDLVMLAIHLYDYHTLGEESAPTPKQSREMAEGEYGYEWRCWLRRPTDEECSGNAWV